jgi:hypothetical protein
MKTRLSFISTLLLLTSVANAANAAVIFDLVIDPQKTAFDGIPAVNGFDGVSTRSGAGTWHLYAYDKPLPGQSQGIANYSVGLIGNIPNINHRSPRTSIEEADGDLTSAGFHLGRTGTNVNPIQGSQAPTDLAPFQVFGFGRDASDFANELASTLPTSTIVGPTTNGHWGTYATDHPALNGLFIAEGTYVGSPPQLDPSLTTAQTFSGLNQFVNATVCLENEFCLIIESFNVYDDDLGEVPRGTTVSAILDAAGVPIEPLTWVLDSFVGPNGAISGAEVDLNTGEFTWNSSGAALGNYSAVIRVLEHGFPGDTGTLTFTLIVPEPSMIAFGTAAIGIIAMQRRRRLEFAWPGKR